MPQQSKEQQGADVEILGRTRVYDGFFKLDEVRHCFRRRDGELCAPLERLVFERGDAVAVLPYDLARRCVILVRQFRLPAHLREGQGWLWEIIAGVIDRERTSEDVARAEALEEAGLRLETLEWVTTCFVSCGGSTERISIYIAPYAQDELVAPGGGLPEEGEDIEVRELSIDEALAMLARGDIRDAKTVIALQHLQLRLCR